MAEKDAIVAFDIDGTLTEEGVKDVYRQLYRRDDISVGIVTANPPFLAERFVNESGLDHDFRHSAFFKVRVLTMEEWTSPRAKAIYVGNSRRDRLAATATGWEFVHVTEVEKVRELL